MIFSDFEIWAAAKGMSLRKYSSGQYMVYSTDYAFRGWLARQPEMDALKAELKILKASIQETER